MKNGKVKNKVSGKGGFFSGVGGFLDGLFKYEEPYCNLTEDEVIELIKLVQEKND